ncbi:hypothetical protein Tco_1055375 [Tanacetum coccineum]|uniref:Uncharacterized protein n=1 Tax=Tanacetum coccineum TaxID=301880 RepID=A0ABQ5GZG4_9ASTR
MVYRVSSSRAVMARSMVILVMFGEAARPIAKSCSHATCNDKKYKKCYNLDHVCPKSCPDVCLVDCVSCKPVCSNSTTPLPSPPPPPPTTPSPPPPQAYTPPDYYYPPPNSYYPPPDSYRPPNYNYPPPPPEVSWYYPPPEGYTPPPPPDVWWYNPPPPAGYP